MHLTHCDERGRIYLKEAVRTRYGEEFIVVEAPSEIVLLPVPDDPVEDLARLGEKLKGISIQDMKAAIRRRAQKEVASG